MRSRRIEEKYFTESKTIRDVSFDGRKTKKGGKRRIIYHPSY